MEECLNPKEHLLDVHFDHKVWTFTRIGEDTHVALFGSHSFVYYFQS